MRGYTIPMTASATVVPNNNYRIKLAIGDYNDNLFDSAVFLEAGSFNVGLADLYYYAGLDTTTEDMTVETGYAACSGTVREINTGLDPNYYNFVWYQDGAIITSETGPSIMVSEPGQYCVEASNVSGASCIQSDCILVEFLEGPEVNPTPGNYVVCDDGTGTYTYNFLDHLSEIIGTPNYMDYYFSTYFYLSQQDAIDDIQIPATYTTNVSPLTVYVKVEDFNFSCPSYTSFVAEVQNCAVITPTQPSDLYLCDLDGDGVESFDLTQQDATVLGSYTPASDYTITYHTTQAGADDGTIDLATPFNAYLNTSNPQTIYVRLEENATGDYGTTTFELNVLGVPSIVITDPSAVCSPNTVDITDPSVTAGSSNTGTFDYWEDAAATIAVSDPTAIDVSGTYYISTTVGSCSDIQPVEVTINPTPSLVITDPASVCSPTTIDITDPAVTAGSTLGGTLSYWEDAAGTIAVSDPTAIDVSGTYYIMSSLGSCSDIQPVVVTINATPSLVITDPASVCSPNTVDITDPAVTSGSTNLGTFSYWEDAAATVAVSDPTAIDISGTYYIMNAQGSCSDIQPVEVTINPTPSLVITDPASVCSPTTIDITDPAVTAGSTLGGTLSYWEDAAGTIAVSDPTAIDVSGTYYIMSSLGSCSDIQPVVVTINATPSLVITDPASVCSPNTVDITDPAVTSGSTNLGLSVIGKMQQQR
ncbi:choice-of-anchor L domain-containing protein [Flavobacterium sediminis]|nr:choice-of-anchor L domain-containing protein [Flavobacterium sediminis]